MLNSETVAFQLDTSKQGYSPDPSSRVGSGVQTRLCSNTDWPVHSLNNTISMLTMNIRYELSVPATEKQSQKLGKLQNRERPYLRVYDLKQANRRWKLRKSL